MKKNLDVRPATIGLSYKVRFDENGHRYDAADVDTCTVQPQCDDTLIGNGIWHCTTCERRFQNQLQKDLHLKDGCVLAWFCFKHGAAEVP